ncbi:Integrase zinc binding domain [Popillia japonica]|uniref:RNA-directed DNA polymerase n=1 Tax=Popillia japonica TaxID=7064 RepID=A0AAW1IED5_POPJA
MRLKILNYDLTVKYIPGRYLYIADTLSRAARKHGSEIGTEFDYAIHALMKQLPISSNKLHQIQRATKEDITLAQVVTYCRNAWPDKRRIPIQVIPYFKIRHQLNVHENLFLLDNKIIIPAVLRKEMLTKIHVAYQGIEKIKARARQVFYWPGINSEIENMIKSCRLCEKFSSKLEQGKFSIGQE